MGDVGIDGRPRRNVARSPGLVALVRAEESGVMPFLHCNQGDPWHVVGLQLRENLVKGGNVGVGNLNASLSDGEQLDLEDFAELAFAHTVPVKEECK